MFEVDEHQFAEYAASSRTRQLTGRTLALVLAGGRGSRLKQLTDHRVKPAVHFGGKFRVIDFVLSNCLNSDMRRIGVITQYKSHSLLRHLQRGWSFLRNERNEFIDLLPAQQQINEEHWYRGTADAVYQNLNIIRHARPPEYIVVLAGDHIYKMDYSIMLIDHVRNGRSCTVGCIEVPRMQATTFGVMAVDAQRNITDFVEKPADPPPLPGQPELALASMGIYIFTADYLYQLLEQDHADPASSHDFGHDVIPRTVRDGQALAHPFTMSCVRSAPELPCYWRDVGTLDAYWAANLDLASITPELDIYDRNWPIWTYQEQLPPAKFTQDHRGQQGSNCNTVVGGGCIVSGSHVSNSVLFSNVRIDSFCQIDQSVILPAVKINRNCRLNRVILDRRCELPEGMVIGVDPALDATRFERTDNGVVLVTPAMLRDLDHSHRQAG